MIGGTGQGQVGGDPLDHAGRLDLAVTTIAPMRCSSAPRGVAQHRRGQVILQRFGAQAEEVIERVDRRRRDVAQRLVQLLVS